MKKPILILLLALFVLQLPAQTLEKGTIDQMRFRHIGPIGNRLNSVSGVAGDPLTYIVGAASGGVWKTQEDKQKAYSKTKEEEVC